MEEDSKKSLYVYKSKSGSSNNPEKQVFHSKTLGKTKATATSEKSDDQVFQSSTLGKKTSKPKETPKSPTDKKKEEPKPASKPISADSPVFHSKTLGKTKTTATSEKSDEQVFQSSTLGKATVKKQETPRSDVSELPKGHEKYGNYVKSDAEIEKMADEISRNLEKQIAKEERKIKAEAKKAQKRKIKSAKKETEKKKYVPHKERSFLGNMINRAKYRMGWYDYIYDTDPNDLSKEEEQEYWEDVDDLEDAEHFDEAFNKKMMVFKLGLASIGLAVSIGLGCHIGNTITAPLQTPEPTSLVTQYSGQKLEYEEKRAQAYMLRFEDQEYLRLRMNEEFIPENLTEEEMHDLMQDAWEMLEPEVQEWVRSPDRIREAQERQKEKEEQRIANQAEIDARNNASQEQDQELGEEIGE